MRNRYNRSGTYFLPEENFEEEGHGAYDGHIAIESPHLLELVNDPKIIAFIAEYFGALPTIEYVMLHWMFNRQGPPTESQFFHMDPGLGHVISCLFSLRM